MLNGRPLYLRGTNIQGLNALWYWQQHRLTDIILMIKAGNFNAVRSDQHVCYPEVRELLDRLGMMSEQDQPSGGNGQPVYAEQMGELPRMGRVLARVCYNNPGVVLLSFGSETYFDPSPTIEAALAVDPERIIIPISDYQHPKRVEPTVPDPSLPEALWANVVHDFHAYYGWYADGGQIWKLSKTYKPCRLVTVGEYGAEALDSYETMAQHYPAHWPKNSVGRCPCAVRKCAG